MASNYDAWDVDVDSLEMPADLLRLAILAPSSHNSQPWHFEITNDSIRVTLDPARRLPASDSNDRQAIISLGCAAEHIVIGAEYYGYDVKIMDYGAETDDAIIRLSRTRESLRDPDHLIHSIPKRVTNRAAYDDRLPDAKTLETIRALVLPSLHLHIVTSKERIARLGDIAVEAGIDAMRDNGFRKELSQYLKPNDTESSLGMPGTGFGFPMAIARIAPFLVRIANMAQLSQKQDRMLFAHTPAIIVISTEHDTPSDWFRTGRAYARLALIATQANMSTAPWGAPIQIGEHYRRIQDALDTNWRPQFFCRLGYPTASTPHTPRLSQHDVQ